jgi:long-chain acyl-CoA synthetase
VKSRTILSIVDSFADRGDKPAIVHFIKKGKTSLTYKELFNRIQRLAGGLQEHGLKQGDSVMMLSGNSPAWIIAFLSVLYCGGVAVPVDSQHGDDALQHIAEDCGAKWVFTDARGSDRLHKLLPGKRWKMFLLDREDGDRSWRELLGRKHGERAFAHREDQAVLFYTSGTTGMPKGVPLKHRNIMSQLDALLNELKVLRPNDRLLLPLPLFHVYPLDLGLLAPLSMGLPVLMPRSLTGPEILRALNEGKATVLIAVPRLLRALYSAIEKKFHTSKVLGTVFDGMINVSGVMTAVTHANLGKTLFSPVHRRFSPTLRLLCCGGAPLDPKLALKLRALGWDVTVGYGLTETAPLLTVRTSDNFDLASVGKALPGVDIRITKRRLEEEEETAKKSKKTSDSETDQENVFTGKEGEVEARGPNVFDGYKDLPEKSEETFTDDGWFRTGDVGYLSHGNLRITGRANTTLVLEGGKKIHPDEVEEKFAKQSGIREIALLQIDRKLVALVVPSLKSTGGKEVDQSVSNALNVVSAQLPRYMRITDFAVSREPLPRNTLGKVKRHELAPRYQKAKAAGKGGAKEKTGPQSIDEMSAEDRSLLSDPVATQAWEWLAQRFADASITMDKSPSLDLNVDSMEWMNLTLELREATGVELTDEAVGRIDTVRDLVQEVVQAAERGDQITGSPTKEPEKFIDKKQKKWLKPLNAWQSGLAQFLFYVNKFFMRLFFNVQAIGLDDLAPNQQYVFTPNHASYIDAFAFAAALSYDQMRKTQWAGWAGIAFGNPIFSFLSRLAQVIPIEAKQSLMSSLALAAGVLKRGNNLVWFPEAERTLDGKLLKFKTGIGMLLENSTVAIVPVYLDGTREAMPPGAALPRPCQIRVLFGDPVMAEQLAKEGDGRVTNECIAKALHDRVEALSRRKISRKQRALRQPSLSKNKAKSPDNKKAEHRAQAKSGK